MKYKISNFKFQILNSQRNWYLLEIGNLKLEISRCSGVGQSLVELLLAIGLAAILLPVLLTAFISSREGKAQQNQRIDAVSLLKEAEEGVRNVRERNWSNIATNGTYHPFATSATWSLAAGSETINRYTRSIAISDVNRDASGKIVASGGAIDPSTKKIDITVSWTTPYASSVTSSLYLAHTTNASFTQTTQADFSAGNLMTTAVTNTAGGEVILGLGPGGDWCTPQNSIVNKLTLPKQGNAIIAQPGSAFIGAGDGTNGPTFINLAISDPAPPATPAASITGTYTSSYQTNDIFSDGHYAYLATNGSSSQVVILDISRTPYTKVGWIDVPSGANANGVYVSNNIAYVTSSNKLYTFDLSTKTGGHSAALTSVSMWIGLGGTPLAQQVVVVNNHAYVGTQNTLFGLQSFAISNNGATLHLVGVSNLTWQQSSQGLTVNPSGTRAYVAFNNGGGFFPKGFFIVDTSAPDPPTWWLFPNFYNSVGSYNTGSMDPRGMAIGTGNKAIVVGINGTQQYQVVDITNENNPRLCGGLAITNGVTGVSAILEPDGDVFSYIITGESRDQFKIIQGGTGALFSTTGTFESSIFDAGSAATFNRFATTTDIPAQTSVTYQVAATNAIAGTCASSTYTYVGPDGTTASYFATPSAIPLSTSGAYLNPARCFRYKAYLSTSDITQTPTLYDVSVNYSP